MLVEATLTLTKMMWSSWTAKVPNHLAELWAHVPDFSDSATACQFALCCTQILPMFRPCWPFGSRFCPSAYIPFMNLNFFTDNLAPCFSKYLLGKLLWQPLWEIPVLCQRFLTEQEPAISSLMWPQWFQLENGLLL